MLRDPTPTQTLREKALIQKKKKRSSYSVITKRREEEESSTSEKEMEAFRFCEVSQSSAAVCSCSSSRKSRRALTRTMSLAACATLVLAVVFPASVTSLGELEITSTNKKQYIQLNLSNEKVAKCQFTLNKTLFPVAKQQCQRCGHLSFLMLSFFLHD